jgi:hypothetical protein
MHLTIGKEGLSIFLSDNGCRNEPSRRQLLRERLRCLSAKKNPQAEACGFNPIQGELEETGVAILRCTIVVLFIVLIRDIIYGDIANE